MSRSADSALQALPARHARMAPSACSRRGSVHRAAIAAATSLLLLVLAAPAARADSLVYMNDGNVWIAHGDGSNARQVTGGPNTWSWPTEDDAGNILVAGGLGSVNALVEDTAGSEIYRLNQQGASLSAPQQTPGSKSTVSCVTYPPQSLRVAPDGRHYAYHAWVCDRFVTLIGTVGGQGFTTEDMSDFRYPYWVDNSDFVISRGGVPLADSDGEWWTHAVGEQANFGFNWFGDPATYAEPGNPDGWATGFDGIAVSRDGTKVATLEEDAANWTNGAAQHVAIRLWSAGGAPTPAHQTVTTPTFTCQLDLPPDPNTTAWFANAGPTFSPDGTRLAFAEPDGVHIANVSNLSNCASITAPLVIPGATQPSWSAADEAANAGYVSPSPGPSPVPPRPVPPHDTTAPKIGALTITPKRFAVAKASTAVSARRTRVHEGATIRYTLSEPARVTLTVELATNGRSKGRRCVTPAGELRTARHCVVLHTKGRLTRTGVSGVNQVGFSGRLGHRKLAPGSYRLVMRATDAAGNHGTAKTLRFTIVKG
jgi:hypothetical protein